MNCQLSLVSESKILHGDIDLIVSFCSFQDTLKPENYKLITFKIILNMNMNQ